MIVSTVKGSPGLRPGRFLVGQLVREVTGWIVKFNCCRINEPTCNPIADAGNKVKSLHIACTITNAVAFILSIVDFKHGEIPKIRG